MKRPIALALPAVLVLCGIFASASLVAQATDVLIRQSLATPTFVNPPVLPTPKGYSHVARVPPGAELIMVSGQIGEDAEGRLPDGIADQYRNAADNIAKLLASQNVPLRNIVKLNTYIVATADTAPLKNLRTPLDDLAPTATLLYVSRLALPGAKVELEVLAMRSPMPMTLETAPPRDFGQ